MTELSNILWERDQIGIIDGEEEENIRLLIGQFIRIIMSIQGIANRGREEEDSAQPE